MNKLLNAQEIAEILNISKPQAYLIMRRGDLSVVRIGRLARVRQEDLDQFVIDQTSIKKSSKSAATEILESSKQPTEGYKEGYSHA